MKVKVLNRQIKKTKSINNRKSKQKKKKIKIQIQDNSKVRQLLNPIILKP